VIDLYRYLTWAKLNLKELVRELAFMYRRILHQGGGGTGNDIRYSRIDIYKILHQRGDSIDYTST
jgi:hypothetical protein